MCDVGEHGDYTDAGWHAEAIDVPIRFYINASQVSKTIKDKLDHRKEAVRRAIRAAAQEAADVIVEHGRQNLQSAGHFGNWAMGWNATVTQGAGSTRISVTMGDPAPPWWIVHQEGRTIHGKPLMWIPLSFAGVEKGMWARDYPGGLFRVDPKSGGAPLLLSIADKQPKYSGHESVTIPKRLNLAEIVETVAKSYTVFLHGNLMEER